MCKGISVEAASPYICFLIPRIRDPPGPFSHVQLCSVLLATLEPTRTWPGASAEGVHGAVFLLVEKEPLRHLSWEPWGCEEAKKRCEAGKPMCLCWSSS